MKKTKKGNLFYVKMLFRPDYFPFRLSYSFFFKTYLAQLYNQFFILYSTSFFVKALCTSRTPSEMVSNIKKPLYQCLKKNVFYALTNYNFTNRGWAESHFFCIESKKAETTSSTLIGHDWTHDPPDHRTRCPTHLNEERSLQYERWIRSKIIT
jgi:hypothetical protein